MQDDGKITVGGFVSAKFDMGGISWNQYLQKSIGYTEQQNSRLYTEKPRAQTALLRLLFKDAPDIHPYHNSRYTRIPIRPIGNDTVNEQDQSETEK